MDDTLTALPVVLFLFESQGKNLKLNMTNNTPHSFPASPIAHLIGHRGLPSLAPENSLESFKLAAKAGLNWVEFDVQVTHDDQLVIMHDDTIDRTTNGTGLVYSLTLDELREYSLHNTHHPILDKISLAIPTLAETMHLLDDLNVQANIELKLPENLTEKEVAPIRTKLLTAFIAYLKSNWPKNKPWPFVSSFDHPILIEVRKLYPDIPLGFLVEEPNPEHLALAKRYTPASVNAKASALTEEFMELANQQNTPIFSYTVNQLEQAQQLLNWGVYGLFTDIGDKLKPLLEKNNTSLKTSSKQVK